MEPIAVPLRELARAEKMSPTRLYELIDAGEIDTFLDGNRRKVVVDSYRRYVERQVVATAGKKLPSSNPKVRKPSPPATARQEGRRRPAR